MLLRYRIPVLTTSRALTPALSLRIAIAPKSNGKLAPKKPSAPVAQRNGDTN